MEIASGAAGENSAEGRAPTVLDAEEMKEKVGTAQTDNKVAQCNQFICWCTRDFRKF